MKRKLILFIVALTLSLSVLAEGRGFAIIIDDATYNACKEQIEEYKNLLNSEGLSAKVFSRVWDNPVQVRDVLFEMYNSGGLEGAVFVGQIPIPMIRDAQHLTSAFKMDQEMFPFRTSSVPSDRFYDDFDLKFDYLGQDSVNTLFHYYSLRGDSPQKISCDIYSGRIKPTKVGEDGYNQLRDYFAKVVRERESAGVLDVITSYTGEGSFSNSLTAWKEEGHTLREQFPAAFGNKNSVKFLFFSMFPYMKDIVTDELRREEMDLMIFHQHGMPHRQYLTGTPYSKGATQYKEAGERLFRNRLLRESDPAKREEMISAWSLYYNIDTSWFAGYDSPEFAVKDSLNDIRTGIVLEDVPVIAPNARVVIFDACYNGDFREEKFIAGEYIFASGKAMVSIGNSVNVLQDKSSSDLMGMLGLGFRVGEWMQLVNILESHIIGDPTFRFRSYNPSGPVAADIDLKRSDPDFWLNMLRKENDPNLQALALHKLFHLEYENLEDLLVYTYYTSDYYTVRLQVYHLLQHYNSDRFESLLYSSVNDPYEFIRRKSVFSMGRIGKDDFIPVVASVYLNRSLDERVHFNAFFGFDLLNTHKMEQEVREQLENSANIYDKEGVLNSFMSRIESRRRIAAMSDNVTNKESELRSRISAVRMLRNNTYHNNVDDYLKVLEDESEDVELRIALAEALGWFTTSFKRADIVNSCNGLLAAGVSDRRFENELIKTVNRLKVYMR